jgi:diadenosine tetraphosphatase ApaH/serine/threonine PP2A family protein phosphatase
VIIAGNHDLGVIDPDIARGFNGAARDALDWTRRTLTPLHMDALTRLPLRATVDPHLTLVHDCPVPAPTDYVHNISIAALAFRGFETTACLLGHTHVPIVFEAPGDVAPEAIVADDVTAHAPGDGQPLRLQIGRRYICNPGSVGQPRDADPRASFAVFDDEALTFTVHRQEYDIDAVQEATYRAGLPFVLAERLSIGA